MPTLVWILEGAEDVSPGGWPTTEYLCEVCGARFADRSAFISHCGLEHPLEVPALYIRGERIGTERVIRSPLGDGDVLVVGATSCQLAVDGGIFESVDIDTLASLLSGHNNSTLNVLLENSRRMDDSDVVVESRLSVRIPSADAMDEIDAAFSRYLVKDHIVPDDVRLFQSSLPGAAADREYGSALGDYALALVIKEQPDLLRSDVGFKEFSTKMSRSLSVLSGIERGLARAVSGAIRFNLNGLSVEERVLVTNVDVALHFMRALLAHDRPGPSMQPVQDVAKTARPACPIDSMTADLIDLCCVLASGNVVTIDCAAEIEKRFYGGRSVSEQDLVKLNALLAETYRRLGHRDEEVRFLERVRFAPVFGDWAQQRLEKGSADES